MSFGEQVGECLRMKSSKFDYLVSRDSFNSMTFDIFSSHSASNFTTDSHRRGRFSSSEITR